MIEYSVEDSSTSSMKSRADRWSPRSVPSKNVVTTAFPRPRDRNPRAPLVVPVGSIARSASGFVWSVRRSRHTGNPEHPISPGDRPPYVLRDNPVGPNGDSSARGRLIVRVHERCSEMHLPALMAGASASEDVTP